MNSFFTDGREVEDHVYLTYKYPKDVVVTYSSLTTNESDQYGEQAMGTRGTLAIVSEREGGDGVNVKPGLRRKARNAYLRSLRLAVMPLLSRV